MPAGVGLEPGAVERDVAEADQAGRAAQPQDLHEQRRERLNMALPEVADGAEVGLLQAPVTAMTSRRFSQALASRREA